MSVSVAPHLNPHPAMIEQTTTSDTRQLLRDRRTTMRFPCALRATCRLAATQEALEADVNNVSPKGIALILNRPLPYGSVLTVELQRGSTRLTGAARVVYVLTAVSGWCHGCQWLKALDLAELDPLVT